MCAPTRWMLNSERYIRHHRRKAPKRHVNRPNVTQSIEPSHIFSTSKQTPACQKGGELQLPSLRSIELLGHLKWTNEGINKFNPQKPESDWYSIPILNISIWYTKIILTPGISSSGPHGSKNVRTFFKDFVFPKQTHEWHLIKIRLQTPC